MIKNKKIFITGGAGYLGSHLVERYYNDNEITVYSRDEAKHYYLKKRFPNIKCIIGDIRNYELLTRSAFGHDIGIFAASLKQIGAVDQNVEFNTLPYIAVDKRTLESSALTMNDSPATNFIAPYNVVAALDLSDDMKQADSKLLSSAALLEFMAPSIITFIDSSTFWSTAPICFKDAANIPIS